MAEVRVVLADDEAMFRAGISAILATEPAISVVGAAADGGELLELVQEHRPDVALVDIQMPRLDGLAAAARIRQASPHTAVVMLTTFGRNDYIARALDAGAGGFVLKSGDPRELIAGVLAVAEGGAFLSPAVARRVVSQFAATVRSGRDAALERVAALTVRERDTLALLGRGLSNAEIARRLALTEHTVKTHVKAILTGLGVANRVRAAIVAHEAGIVDPPGS